jgi:hypothetical protein
MLAASLKERVDHKIPAIAAQTVRLMLVKDLDGSGRVAVVENLQRTRLFEGNVSLGGIGVTTGGTTEDLTHFLEALILRRPFQKALLPASRTPDFHGRETHRRFPLFPIPIHALKASA